MSTSPKRATNITVSGPLVLKARRIGLDVSQAAQNGIAKALAKRRVQLWQGENTAAIRSSNEFVEKQGLPLGKYRLF